MDVQYFLDEEFIEMLKNCKSIKPEWEEGEVDTAGCVGNKIITASGKVFDFNAMSGDAICIEDIGLALSRLCRFTGHCKWFYSVAQHSVLCYELSKKLYPMTPELWFAALMHDAQEAFLADISSPLKSMLPRYQELESELELIISEKFNVSNFYAATVKHIDRSMLKAEKRRLLPESEEWPELDEYPDYEVFILKMTPEESRRSFMAAYEEAKQAAEKGSK